MKNIEDIVKRVAERYNVAYDEYSSGPKMKYVDGSIKILDRIEFEKLFPKPDEPENWHEVKSVRIIKIRGIRKQLKDSSNEHDKEFNIEELVEMTS